MRAAFPSASRPGGRGALQAAALLALAAAAAQAQEAPLPDPTGVWVGSATFTNEWAAPACEYVGLPSPPAVVLDLKADGGEAKGSVTIDIPAPAGSGCPPLHKEYSVLAGRISEGSLTFRDPAGHGWDLAVRSDELRGIVGWKGGGADEPLSEGFVGPGGLAPHTRLSGEVTLKRATKVLRPEDKRPKPSAFGAAKGVTSVIVANAVAAAALVLVHNALTKPTVSSPPSGCSPRFCPGVCSLCTTSVLSNGDCKGTAGVGLSQLCDLNNPCLPGLSCFAGRCEDPNSPGAHCPTNQ